MMRCLLSSDLGAIEWLQQSSATKSPSSKMPMAIRMSAFARQTRSVGFLPISRRPAFTPAAFGQTAVRAPRTLCRRWKDTVAASIIRANKCESLYDDILTLRGWRKEEINGIDFELLLSAKRQRPMPNLLMIRDWVKFQTRTSPYSAKTVPSAGGEAAISSSIPFKSVSGWLKNFSMLR